MVTALVRPEPKPTFALTFNGPNGEKDVFRATSDHPWYTSQHDWVRTDELEAGDLIETATGVDVQLVLISPSGRVEHTFNLEVSDLHTFLIGKNHLVVHNCPWSAGRRALEEMAKKEKYVTRADVDAYRDLNRTLPDPIPEGKIRIDDPGHPNSPHQNIRDPHAHIGNADHIPLF